MALAGLFSALRVTGGKLTDQTVLFLGAGEAATGIADLVVSAMVAEGLPKPRRFDATGWWICAAWSSRIEPASPSTSFAMRMTRRRSAISSTAIDTLKPTAIIGVAAVGGAFTPEVLQAMAKINDRPIVFALSNPTSKAECSAEEAYRHTGGRALFACGSPFDPVKFEGKTFVPRQGNNSYIFPGVGLGATACGARLVTDEMFMVAAHALANLVTEADLAQGSLYPALPRIREVSAHIAESVAMSLIIAALRPATRQMISRTFIQSQMYDPQY